MQCIGCHGKVGNTVDSVWSFQRKLPAEAGWREMDYGTYDSKHPKRSHLQDYAHENSSMGEFGYFYHSVIGADLYGVMPDEVAGELKIYAAAHQKSLDLKHAIDAIFDDDLLKKMAAAERRAHLLDSLSFPFSCVRDKKLCRLVQIGSYIRKCLISFGGTPITRTVSRPRGVVTATSTGVFSGALL